ncbi:MAG: tRNA (adenosine(37)-N6)-threonylcarbamoyltransferase complex transferase subunit TsaD [Bacteroidia bacterium]|nr:tRNA (adenosine(37)-N6)-threonylcarbamoyltransferase complex transferase subunit TsaD [Bacteroidia bacterium]
MSSVYILAIESSCDDTSVAILKDNEVLSNVVCNQRIHEKFGGVVPELASRDHLKNIIVTIDAALKEAAVTLKDINAIAVTRGPGLIGSLLVGISAAKSLSLSLQIPLIEINHIQAHILAHFIKNVHAENKLQFPFLGLIVSGGHTQLVLVKNYLEYEVLGETLDDAAGEALDKGAKILGLGFPGGPIIDTLAQTGNENQFTFPKAHIQELHFSFSGIKTALLYLIQKEVKQNPDFIKENLNDLCASYQKTIVEMLINGVQQALETTNLKQIAIAGGVSANSKLRKELQQLSSAKKIDTFLLPLKYCTDNAAMIGIAAYYKYLNKDFASLDIVPITRWEGFTNK